MPAPRGRSLTPMNPPGPRWISSWATRRFWAGRCSAASWATPMWTSSSRSVDGRMPRQSRPVLLLVREGPRPHRGREMQTRRTPGHPGHPGRGQPRGPQAHQGDAATSSSPRATGPGFSTAPMSMSAWWGLTRARRRSGFSTGRRCPSSTPTSPPSPTSRRRRRLLRRIPRLLSWAIRKAGAFDIEEIASTCKFLEHAQSPRQSQLARS